MCVKKRKKVFISHNSVDRVFCDGIFRLVTILIGSDRSKIFYSSKAKYGVPNGANIIQTMKQQYEQFDLFMIIASSPHYYRSPKSLNEMGAAWVLNQKCIVFMSPDASFEELNGVIDSSVLAIHVIDNEETRDRLDLFAEDLTSFFKTKMPAEDIWEKEKNDFLESVSNNKSPLSSESQSLANSLSDSFKRDNDIKWMNDLFGHFSFNLMQEYIDKGPEYIDSRIPISYDIWRSILNTYTFVIYDEALLSHILHFYSFWDKIMSDNWKYYELSKGNPNLYHFYGLSFDVFESEDAEKKFRDTICIMKDLDLALKQLAEYVTQNYEINLNKLSARFEKESY